MGSRSSQWTQLQGAGLTIPNPRAAETGRKKVCSRWVIPKLAAGNPQQTSETGKTHKASAILPFECHLLSLTYWLLIGVHPFLDQPNGKRTCSWVNCTSQTQANDSGLCRLGWWDFPWLRRTCQRSETGKLRLRSVAAVGCGCACNGKPIAAKSCCWAAEH